MLSLDDLLDIEAALNRSKPPRMIGGYKQAMLVVDEHLRCLELLRAEIKERFENGERSEYED